MMKEQTTDGAASELTDGLGFQMSHRNCSEILPARSFPLGATQWLRERTHGCWCSAWSLTQEGEWLIWTDAGWTQPKKGEILKKKPNVELTGAGTASVLNAKLGAEP